MISIKKIQYVLKQSRVFPGFAVLNVRYTLGVGVAFLILIGLIGVTNSSSGLILTMPKAQASATIESGVAEFSSSQKVYMTRSLYNNYDNLVKFEGASVKAILGEPELVRADLPTVVWQYRNKKCVLDIYFKSDDRNVNFSEVVHYEMRDRDYRAKNSFEGQEASCLKSLLPPMTAPRMLSVSSIYKSYIQ